MKLIKSLILLVVSIIFAASVATASAASTDTKLIVSDDTNHTTVCTATYPSNCNSMTLTGGHVYVFQVMRSSGLASSGNIKLTHVGSRWDNEYPGYAWSGGTEPTCTWSDPNNGTVQESCTSTSSNIVLIQIVGTAISGVTVDNGTAQVVTGGVSGGTVSFSYTTP